MNNEVELQQMIDSCANEYEYDSLIDKLFLINSNNRNNKNSHEYSFFSAQVMKKKNKKELSTDFDYL